MLPSFRLIAATFCCGFLVVFAGLRLAATFNSVNQALPVMAAHAAPIRIAALTDQDQRRHGTAMVPVTYDLRFAVSATQPAPVAAAAATDRTPPLLMPLVILPPIARDTNEATTETTNETTTVAALPSQPATGAAPATIDIPLPEPATVDLTFSPSPAKAKDQPSVAAVSPAPAAQVGPSIDIPLPEPATVDLTFSPAPASVPAPAKPDTEIGPKSEVTPSTGPETDARAGSAHDDAEPITVAALPEEIPPGTVVLPASHIPLPKPKAADKPVQRTAALHPTAARRATRQAAAKPRTRPRRQAVARGDDFQSFFNFPSGKQR